MIATPRRDRGVAVAFPLRDTEAKRRSIVGVLRIYRLTVSSRRRAHVLAVKRATSGREEPIAWLRITNGNATDSPVPICGWRFLGSYQQTALDANAGSANRANPHPNIRDKLVSRTPSRSRPVELPARP